MTRRSWFCAFFACVVWTVVSVNANQIASWAIPHSWWLDVRDVQVRSVTDGGSPRVILDRDINREIHGAELITVVYPIAGGGYQKCVKTKSLKPLLKDSVFGVGQDHNPRNVSLAEMQDVPPNSPCTFEDGDYRVDFTWKAPNVFWWLPGITLSQTHSSNLFNWQDGEK